MALHGSVGLGGRNWRPDVMSVQRMLEQLHISPGLVDGRCGRRTIEAIEHFQQHFLNRPDGRIDVNGPTWRQLERQVVHAPIGTHASAGAAAASQTAPSQPVAGAVRPSGARPSVRTVPPRAGVVAPAPVAPLAARVTTSGAPRSESSHFWSTRTALPAPGTVNLGLSCPTSAQMEQIFGDPHGSRTTSRLAHGRFGADPVTALAPALASLNLILGRVRTDLPDLYALLGTAGAYNLRNIRGRNCYSNHSWGTAIDVKVDGLLVPLGAAYSCKGLDALCSYFNAAGWYWGGGYHNRKDCMHFETGLALARTFA
jgi:hypothetical protein